MSKKKLICTWIRNLSLVPLMASLIWLVSKGSRALMLYNGTMLAGGRGIQFDLFTDIDKYILSAFVISLTIFLVFNRMRKRIK